MNFKEKCNILRKIYNISFFILCHFSHRTFEGKNCKVKHTNRNLCLKFEFCTDFSWQNRHFDID